jgi:hypothetical protein
MFLLDLLRNLNFPLNELIMDMFVDADSLSDQRTKF